ncbi:MAG: hypothetical protein ACPGRW_06320 [Flavobacteriaceae bacterium]
MNIDDLRQQLQQLDSLKNQNRQYFNVFEQSMDETIKGANKEQRAAILEVKALSKRAIELAKAGKTDEIKEIMDKLKNKYTNGR